MFIFVYVVVAVYKYYFWTLIRLGYVTQIVKALRFGLKGIWFKSLLTTFYHDKSLDLKIQVIFITLNLNFVLFKFWI